MEERFVRRFATAAVVAASVWLVAGCQSQPPAETPSPTRPIEQGAGTPPPPEQRPAPPVATEAPKPAPVPAVLPSGYGPTRIEVLPLTELAPSTAGGTQLNAYVSLLDAFGSQVKAPGAIRFELYEYVQRSAEPKGQRIAIWPDIDLTDPAQNNRYWQDFLRAYAFELTAEAPRSRTYILETTCMCPDGKRLSADFTLKPEE